MKVQLNNNFTNEYFETKCEYVNGLNIFYKIPKSTNQNEKFLNFEIEFGEKINKFTYYDFGWGQELRKNDIYQCEGFSICNDRGRSSLYGTFFQVNDLQKIAIGYSGNWKIKIDSNKLIIQIEPGFSTQNCHDNSPKIFASDDTQSYYKYIEQYAPSSGYQEQLPIEFNHWWAYEDVILNEDNFLANCRVAKEIGVDFALLDAGWFGIEGENWFDIRGDWDIENKVKFPSGIENIANKVRELGLDFGIWIEPEGLGKNAQIRKSKPEIIATRNGEDLGYVCLGSKEGYNFVLDLFDNIIEKTKCKWIKIDFNLDPGLGCDDTTHNHGKNDGLYIHYMNWYKLLLEVNQKYPDVVLENCASGGQRLDFGMFLHTHCSFLSDPDYIEHHDICYREITNFFPPSRILHWMWSETYNVDVTKRPFPSIEINSGNLSDDEIKYYIRKVFIHNFGISHKMENYSEDIKRVLKEEIHNYKKNYREYVKENNMELLQEGDIDTITFTKENRKLIFIFDNNKKKCEIKIEGK